jgi:hypothetical protein
MNGRMCRKSPPLLLLAAGEPLLGYSPIDGGSLEL